MSHSIGHSFGEAAGATPGDSMTDWNRHHSGLSAFGPAGHHDIKDGFDAVEAYFECITTCSLDDAQCITVCTTKLRDHN